MNALRLSTLFLGFAVAVTTFGCVGRTEPASSPSPNPSEVAAVPTDWGPAYVPGIEHGPASVHLSGAFQRAEAFLAKQPFAKLYAKRACSGGATAADERFVDVQFALLSDASGGTRGTVRVDTAKDTCVWRGNVNQ